MMRAPNWSETEFETLISSPQLSSQQLADLLPQRTDGAVEVVRQGLHSYHTGGNTSMLSKMMLQRLDTKHDSVTCPICETRF